MVKVNTKGKKQILEENASALFFYRVMSFGAMAVYLLCCWLLFNNYSSSDQMMVIVSAVLLFACNRFLSSMARPKMGPSGEMLDEGCDLNMEGGIAEHVKDVVILTSTSLCLSSISSYFWLLLLLAPGRAFQMLWSSFIKPWLFDSSPAPEQTEELDERAAKKQKKLERRQKRGY